MCEDFFRNFGDKKLAVAAQQRFVFQQAIFEQRQLSVIPPPSTVPA
jgi:hypothetical protein